MVGALLALASGKAERRQVHPLKSTTTSVCSVKSVGDYLSTENSLQARPDTRFERLLDLRLHIIRQIAEEVDAGARLKLLDRDGV